MKIIASIVLKENTIGVFKDFEGLDRAAISQSLVEVELIKLDLLEEYENMDNKEKQE